jgi:pimeloyl-ACP methyl ester carboxylesterase
MRFPDREARMSTAFSAAAPDVAAPRSELPKLLQTARGPLEYAEAGAGPAVLAVHGAMGGHDQSMLLARVIGPPGFRYLAVSRPGYLGTPLASGRSADEQADLLAAGLDALGVQKAAVMAVSGGGYSALQFALRHPDRCWGLVLVSTISGKTSEKIPLRFHVMKRLMRWPWFVNGIRRKASRDPMASVARAIQDPAARARTLADPEAGPLLAELTLSTLDRAWQRLDGTDNDIAITRSTEYELERIAAPALVVHGTSDPVASFAHGQALARRIPGAELLAVEGGEHVAIFTHRDEVRARVAAFLARCAPRD